MPKKGQKNEKKYFFVYNKYQSDMFLHAFLKGILEK